MSSDSPKLSILQKDLEYRHKRQWDIFSWCSTLLVAITGGVIALETTQSPHPLTLPTQLIISLAVVVLAGYAVHWIHYDAKCQTVTVDLLNKEVNLEQTVRKHAGLGYRGAIVLLALAAILAIWYPLGVRGSSAQAGQAPTAQNEKR